MLDIQGKYNTARVFTDNIDDTTISQIINLLNQDFTEGAQVRIMPDCHAGAGCVIGFTADLGEKVVPNLVGVDIGCGMFVVNLGREWIDLEHLDRVIHERVPAGRNIHTEAQTDFFIDDMFCIDSLKGHGNFSKALGTLGGGNHFIEMSIDDETGDYYLVIHSGSRNLGKQVADIYQDMAIDACKGLGDLRKMEQELIERYKGMGQQGMISRALNTLRSEFHAAQPVYPKELCFLAGEQAEMYLHDMNICQEYASLNRRTMADIILMGILGTDTSEFESFETVHNYVDFSDNVIRKGAVRANAGERLIIPMNMRDGSLICVGKGNADWNNSAPHGAGRIMSRGEAKRRLNVEDFQQTMAGIFTTTATEATLDEAPMAYKPMGEIVANIQDTVAIEKIIKPVYNFKAGE